MEEEIIKQLEKRIEEEEFFILNMELPIPKEY